VRKIYAQIDTDTSKTRAHMRNTNIQEERKEVDSARSRADRTANSGGATLRSAEGFPRDVWDMA